MTRAHGPSAQPSPHDPPSPSYPSPRVPSEKEWILHHHNPSKNKPCLLRGQTSPNAPLWLASLLDRILLFLLGPGLCLRCFLCISYSGPYLEPGLFFPGSALWFLQLELCLGSNIFCNLVISTRISIEGGNYLSKGSGKVLGAI